MKQAEEEPKRPVEEPEPQRIAASPHGMVSSQHRRATEAGVEMLEAGGNAVDAAVATALALGVCEPQASGLGGQSVMLIYTAETRKTVALDGSSRSPTRATQMAYEKKRERLRGYRATTVPSSPACYGYAVRKFGRLPWHVVCGPAIRIAEEGYRISKLQRRLQKRERNHWKDGNAGDIFLLDGAPREVGSRFQQPALANTLRRLAEAGVEDFYTGEIATAIDADMQRHDGFLRLDDLAQIPWPLERRPLSGRYQGLRVLTYSEPGAGRTLIEMLNLLSEFPEAQRTVDSPRGALLLAEVIRLAQNDRRDRPFEPNYYQQVENRRLTSAAYAKEAAKQIKAKIDPPKPRRNRAKKSAPQREPADPSVSSVVEDELRGETTHLSVMDADGNAVALTQSIERVYGSFVATPDLGFLYNDYMSAFEFEDYRHPYYLRPNAVPWASVAPSIVFRGRKPWLTIGSPGSERITTAIALVLLRLLRHQSPLEAVSAPRLHCSIGGRVSLEASMLRDDIPPQLKKRGFTIDRREAWSFYLGCVQLVLREGGTLVGVADPRRDGSAMGAKRSGEDR